MNPQWLPGDCIVLEIPFNNTQFDFTGIQSKRLSSRFIQQCRITVYLFPMLLPLTSHILYCRAVHRLWIEIHFFIITDFPKSGVYFTFWQISFFLLANFLDFSKETKDTKHPLKAWKYTVNELEIKQIIHKHQKSIIICDLQEYVIIVI